MTQARAATKSKIGNVKVGAKPVGAKPKETVIDALSLYMKDIGQAPLLTAEEEVYYARKVQKDCIESKNRMIESNLRLVVKISRRYSNRGLTLLDLIEEGNLGLIRAVEKFDPELGYRFSTYATWWIRQTVERGLMNQTRTIRLPIHVLKEMNTFLRTQRELAQTLDHDPTADDIAATMDQPIEKVYKMLVLNERVGSVDIKVGSGDEKSKTLVETIADQSISDPEELLSISDIGDSLTKWLDQLPVNQREVLTRRFGLLGHDPSTLEKVGSEIGLTRERVRQIQVEALKRMRQMISRQGLDSELLLDN